VADVMMKTSSAHKGSNAEIARETSGRNDMQPAPTPNEGQKRPREGEVNTTLRTEGGRIKRKATIQGFLVTTYGRVRQSKLYGGQAAGEGIALDGEKKKKGEKMIL